MSMHMQDSSSSIAASSGVATFGLLTPFRGAQELLVAHDMNRRAIQLQFHAQFSGASVLVAPPNAETAPPGYYMLFLLDATRTPSKAMIVRVG
jgi:hypothetical protein